MAKKTLSFSQMLQKQIDKQNKKAAEQRALMAKYSRDGGKTVNIMDMLNQMAEEKKDANVSTEECPECKPVEVVSVGPGFFGVTGGDK